MRPADASPSARGEPFWSGRLRGAGETPRRGDARSATPGSGPGSCAWSPEFETATETGTASRQVVPSARSGVTGVGRRLGVRGGGSPGRRWSSVPRSLRRISRGRRRPRRTWEAYLDAVAAIAFTGGEHLHLRDGHHEDIAPGALVISPKRDRHRADSDCHKDGQSAVAAVLGRPNQWKMCV